MKLFAVSGYKNSGKTTLCLALLRHLQTLGVRTAYIKRTAEDELLASEGTDTGQVREVGVPALLWGKSGVRLEADVADDVSARQLAAQFYPDAEIVILEGGKELALPKIWVCSEGEDAPAFPGIVAFYDRRAAGDRKKIFASGDEEALASFLADQVRGAAYRSAHVYIGDKSLPMKDFVADFVRGGIVGMLAALKGGDAKGEDIRVYLDGKPEGKAADGQD